MRAGTVPIVVGVLGSAAVAGVYRQPLRRWPLSVLGAAPSAVASEAPALLIGLHALAAAGALGAGGGRRAAGLAVNAAGLAGLAGLVGDTARSARALAAAVRETGVDDSDDGWPTHPGRVLLGPAARRRYRRASDVRYGALGAANTLDVWHREDLAPGTGAPVLLQVHGGSWSRGDKLGQAESLLGYLAERGWVCVTVNYRLAPAARWPAMIVDVKRAIGWVRREIAGFGGDPEFVAITGGSAGGHLAALAALSPNDPDYQPGFEEVDTALVAAVPLYGVHDFTRNRHGLWPLLERTVIGTAYEFDQRTWRRASPVHRIGAHAPPFLVVHGSSDAIVGVGQSRRFVAALRAGSPAPVGYAELPHAQHGFDAFPTARTAHTGYAMHRFLMAVHRRALAGRAGQTGRNEVPAAR